MSLYTLEHGDRAQPTVVFLHGAGVTSWMWHDTMQALPQLHSLAPDLPGLGQSAHLGPFKVASAARQLATFIAERATDGRAHVVGHSLGGAVAAHLTAHFPQVVRSATLIGVTARPIRFEGALVWAMVGLGPLIRTPWMIRMQARALGVPSHAWAMFERDQQAMTGAVLRAVMTEGVRFRVPPGLRLAGVPLLTLVGLREGALNVRSAVDLVEGVPGAQALGIAGGSHTWMARQQGLLAQTLTAFWSGREVPNELVELTATSTGPSARPKWTAN
ncbi:alpha/beta fold hydrolase [Deinococcus apachensis]|uniref:alpha/beta fold hydrolase n=1 Tax=Deinococcus apachensis TaxID=309886 RepID=UPI00035D67CC|nr:alpha/beta hydrolase [Deinococcus apachensis]